MAGVNVRRLAAIDMFGTRGTPRRRWIILAEFVLGALVLIGFGVWLALDATSLGDQLFGFWAILAGLNYVPLAAYAIALSRAGAIDAELAGVDAERELRRYGVAQLWIVVPLWLVGLVLRERLDLLRRP
jgi:hypothetical protein